MSLLIVQTFYDGSSLLFISFYNTFKLKTLSLQQFWSKEKSSDECNLTGERQKCQQDVIDLDAEYLQISRFLETVNFKEKFEWKDIEEVKTYLH